MTHKCCCGAYFGFHDIQQSLCAIHAPQRWWEDTRSSANGSALMTQYRLDIASAFTVAVPLDVEATRVDVIEACGRYLDRVVYRFRRSTLGISFI